MKILFLTHKFYPEVGGIEVNSEILANGFVREGHQVRLLTWTTEIGERSFPFDIFRKPSLQDLYQAHEWADIVYENNLCLRLAWPNLFIHRPLVVAIRCSISRTNGKIEWQDKLKKHWLKRASRVISVSEAIRKKNWPKAKVIGNPYRIEKFKILPEAIKSRSLVFLGRLVSDKGANLAIEALAELYFIKPESENRFSSLNLTIIGDGPDKPKLEKLAKDLKVDDKIIFTGKLQDENLVFCLNQHKIILVPSICEEAFGNVVLEGMACGCIPIVSDRGGLPDAVGKAGLTFKSGDLNALVQTIKKVLVNPDLEKNLKREIPEHLKSYHPDKVAQKYLDVINSVL